MKAVSAGRAPLDLDLAKSTYNTNVITGVNMPRALAVSAGCIVSTDTYRNSGHGLRLTTSVICKQNVS